MKRILSTLTLLLCFAFTAVNAQVITVERAAEIANSFFSAGVQKSGAARGVVASSGLTASFDSNDVTDAASANPTFYVLTNPEGGFVIVSGEETENPIIGYSFDGTIDTSNLPDGFVDYMTDIDAQVKALREYNANNPQKAAAARSAMARAADYEYNATTMGNIVKDLKVANFHQDPPFNNLCFTTDGRQAVAGCVPIAYAMLCNYYNWPIAATGTGVHAGTGETMQFGHEYDWNNILDDYSGTYTDEQATAVATLVRDLGWAYQVGYGVSDTGSGKTEGASVLIEQFGFKSLSTTHSSNTYATDRDVYNNDEGWKAIIKDCLNNNYPIPYSAYNTSTKGRHIFMLDGYTDNDYYHFNWGWGDGNGWFTLDNMVPSANKTYTSVHRAYFYLMPNTTTYTVEATVNDSNMGTVSINGGTAGSTATANLFSGATATLTAHPAQGYALANWTKGGVVVGSRNTIQVTVGTDANDYVANFDAEANVYVIKDYIISPSTVGLTGSSKESVVNYQTSDEYPAALSLASTATNGTSLSAMSRISDDQIRLYAYDQATSSTTVKYTLSVPDGYQITEYKFDYSLNSTDYPCTITYSGGTISPNNTTWTSSPVIVNNAKTAEFTISAEKAHASSNFYIKNFIVTVAKISSEGGAITPATYSINITKNPTEGGSVTINGDAVSQKSVNENSTVTLVATPQTGYRFVNWTDANNGSEVSTSATYSYTATSNKSLVANFEQTQYTVTVAAGEGGVAYIGTKGTTSTTANYNDNLTITAEANDGYRFVEWRAFDSHFTSNAQQDVTVTTDVTYTAVFEAEAQEPEQPTVDPLAGKFFRLKVYNDDRYMNVKNHTAHDQKVTAGGVNIAAKVEDSNAQIFFFEQSGNGYMLKDGDGYYIKGLEWSVDASSTNSGSVLFFEETAIEDVYYIKWNNTYKGDERYFKVGADSKGAGDHPYCDVAANQKETAAAKWVLEEVVYYTVTATAGEGGSASASAATVKHGASVTLTAQANDGYHFVNWTKDGVEVSTDANYTIDSVTADGEYVANFEEIVVNATLTDAQGNRYEVQLSGFTTGITTATVAAKLTEKYPYITLGDNATLDNAAYTYTNMVELPFKVSSVSDATKTYLHNIYYPSNNKKHSGYPNYIAAFNDEDNIVDMAESPDDAYGYNPTYNTMNGNPKISWAVYSVNNSFEFIFKNELTNKYIKVESVSSSTTNNVKFVENAGDATAFTFLKDAGSYNGDYALVAKVGDATGYLCATSSSTNYVTHFDKNDHQGAWVKIVEAPDYFTKIMDMSIMLGLRFGVGDGMCVIAGTNIEEVDSAMQNSDSITLNKLNDYAARMEAAMATENPTWFNVTTSAENGAAYITLENDDPELTSKRVPGGYELTVKATPATGYHFTGWTMNGTAIEGATEELRFTVTEATTIVASFAINTYNVNVTAGEGGSASASAATVEHGASVTLTAQANDGYHFVNWTLNGNVVSTDANYTVTNVTANAEYVANFQLANTPATHCNVTVNTNISGTGIAFIHTGTSTDATSGRYEVGSTITLTAVSDKDENGYLFTGWYVDGEDEPISTEKTYTVTLSSDVIYTAMFEEGWRVTYSCNYRMGYIRVLDADSNDIGGTNYVLVEKGSTIQVLGVPESGYEFKNWTANATSDFVSSNNPYSFAVEENMSLTANFEPEHYVLTVRANNDSYGTVTAESGTFGPDESVKVGIAMTATITATANIGYRFVNWTKDSKIVSTDAIYTVPSVDYSKDLIDTEYVANFVEADALDAGYYRIAYDFPVAAAKASATRAATDGTVEYVISQETGTQDYDPGSVWEYTTNNSNQPQITMTATSPSGSSVKKIDALNDKVRHSLIANVSKTELSVIYTIAVSGDFKITGYSIDVEAYGNLNVIHNGNSLAISSGIATTLSGNDLDTSSFVIEVGTSKYNQSAALDINSFVVYIEKEITEIPTERYYVQSGAVNATNNAMPMTTDGEGVASIFYYDGGKLLSYQKGTYVKEEGATCGLQDVGTSGNAMIKVVGTNDEDENICTVAAPYFMHANSNGYYVSNCDDTSTCDEHNFILEEVESLPVTITDAGYATWYAPVAVQLPKELTAYTITIQGNYAVTGTGFEQVPANTAVILEGAEGPYELEIIGSAPEVESIMKGTVAATYIEDDAYVLGYINVDGEKVVGFGTAVKNQEGNTSWKNNSHKAYLPKSAVSGASLSAGFRLILPGTTAVEDVEIENEREEIYDLTGRKLEGISGTGIYIVNGKKVIVR